MEEAVVLVFDCVPSNILQVYWKNTLNDIKVKLRLYLGQRQAEIVQDLQNMSIVASRLFGGEKSDKGDAIKPQTKAEMENAFKSVFG